LKDEWLCSQRFDVIACLNVLDRCSKPVTLLQQIKQLLKPNGLVFVAVVLPFNPYVEQGTRVMDPEEELDIEGDEWEECVNNFVTNVIRPNGFTIWKLSRVPYVSEGDHFYSNFVLHNALFVLQVEQHIS
jgi:SAM-dependent methyltransferase